MMWMNKQGQILAHVIRTQPLILINGSCHVMVCDSRIKVAVHVYTCTSQCLQPQRTDLMALTERSGQERSSGGDLK